MQLVREIRWELPPHDYYKLNINGASKDNPSNVGCSAMVKDSDNNWVISYNKGLRMSNNFIIELYGLRDCLLLIYEMGLILVVVELNTLESFGSYRK